jgi:membrane-associated phospholipid phosphatase
MTVLRKASRRRHAIAIACLSIAAAGSARAQRPGDSLALQDRPARPASVPIEAGVPLFRSHDLVIGAGVAGMVLALMPADHSIAHALQQSGVQANGILRGGAHVFNLVGFPGSVVFSAGAYFIGLGTHSRRVAALGMHTGEAIVLAGVIDELLKGAIGRARPYVRPGDSDDYRPGGGFSNGDYASLPSGHVTIAFALATMASREVGRSWPGASKYVTPISYGAATLVAFARVYTNQHWASDVVGAAGLGTLAGVLFDRYNRGHPNNVFDRTFLPASIVPERGGTAVAWDIPVRW